ncbi:MAG: SLC5 family protein, partial [Pseudomonadota bacterium]
MLNPLQIGIFLAITGLIGIVTYLHCRSTGSDSDRSGHDYFLANGGLAWYFVAGSITLTNLSTDQLVGMNGNQMLLLAWWELAAVVGLIILAYVFLPIYYRNKCTTTTELLQKKYNDKHIRALISVLFLLGNLFIFLPAVLYSGALFLKSMLGIDVPILPIAAGFAVIGSLYAILGGLRAVAVS